MLQFIQGEEHSKIYEQYRFNEAWNSPHNQKATAKMPDVFRHPSDPLGTTKTGYYVVTGDQTPFPKNRSTSLADMTDGTSNTVMIVEAKQGHHWARPEDIDFDPGRMKDKLMSIGTFDPDVINVAMGDGSISRIRLDKVTNQILDFLLLSSDGNVFDLRVSVTDRRPQFEISSRPYIQDRANSNAAVPLQQAHQVTPKTIENKPAFRDFSIEQLNQSKSIQEQILETKIELKRATQRFQRNHPNVRAIQEKLKFLEQVEAEIRIRQNSISENESTLNSSDK